MTASPSSDHPVRWGAGGLTRAILGLKYQKCLVAPVRCLQKTYLIFNSDMRVPVYIMQNSEFNCIGSLGVRICTTGTQRKPYDVKSGEADAK